MGQIKTALELALERTKDIQGDRTSLEAKEFREQGMRLLAQTEADPGFDLAAELGRNSGDRLTWIKEGIRQHLLNYLSLPTSPESLKRLQAVQRVFLTLSKRPQEVQRYLAQIGDFLQTYLQNKDQLVQAVRQQFEPVLRKKEDQLAKQTGHRVRIDPETDPEYNSFLNKNLENLQIQFSSGLDQARQELVGLLDK
jgi:hypothetical protein